MQKFLPLFLLLFAYPSFSQHPTCDGERYLNEVFTEVKMTAGLKFGAGTTIAGNNKELFLDVYEPVGDNAEKRPLVILAFGGSYITGDRSQMASLCETFAKQGFVAVTIDYRLYDLPLIPLPTEDEMIDVVVRSISDMKAAIRFMREDAATDNEFRVDPNLVFVGGVSAGAITACHTAVMDPTDEYSAQVMGYIEANGGFEGNSSDNYQYTSEVQGYLNFSGGLHDADWMDAEDPPFISVHDEGDNIVPFNGGYGSIFNVDIVYMEGSGVLRHVADSLAIKNELKTFPGNGHVSYFQGDPQVAAEVRELAFGFLHELICDEFVSAEETSETMSDLSVFPNPTNGVLFVKNGSSLPLRLTLVNALGQPVGRWDNSYQIDLSGFQHGLYFLQMENLQSHQVVARKVWIGK